jgi:hypothetical protein
VVDNIFEDYDAASSLEKIRDRRKLRPGNTRQGSPMDVEARDALQNGLRRKVNRHISAEIGKTAAHVLNAFEPLVTGENGEGKVASQKGSLQDFQRLSDIDAFLGFAPRPESNIGEVSVIRQPLV